MTAVAAETHEALAGISAGRADVLEEVLALREAQLESSGLDERTFSLVQIAVLIALDAPPAQQRAAEHRGGAVSLDAHRQ